MATPVNAVLCALIATAFWTFLGYALTRRLLPRALAIGAAPVIGWAVHSAATLPILTVVGFHPVVVVAIAALCVAIAGVSLWMQAPQRDAEDAATIPLWAFAAAGLLAAAPAAAILPKLAGDAVQFSDPIFDHAKVAIVDAMTRLGLPPVNPVFAEPGTPGHLVYYYLWHFSAAQLALPLPVSGWDADVALTWFTAFASLALMMGLAVWLSRRSAAAIGVVVLATTCSLWTTFGWIFHTDNLAPFLAPPIGMAGWLFQAAWVPQHLMAASCVVTAVVLISFVARRQSPLKLATLALTIVAGFESSTFVGGVTFAIGALCAAPFVFAAVTPGQRLRFIAGLVGAAALAAALAAPFIRDQLATVTARGNGHPLVVAPYEVFGEWVPQPLRHWLDLPAYWLVLLPIELPATYLAGLIGLGAMLRASMPRPEKLAVTALICLAGASLGTSWLLVSTLGDNNDLGLRAVIPGEAILIVGAAAALTPTFRRRFAIIALAIGGFVLALPDTTITIRDYFLGLPRPGGEVFARTPAMWAAVRRYAGPSARVANNPLFLSGITAWPVNISWALLADRGSCFAGRELTLAYAALPSHRREAINAQFVRVFAGQGTQDDVGDLAKTYGCDVIVVTAQDGAWDHDPFGASADYRLAETRAGAWRIYVRAPPLKSPQTN
jgi:hypothetical protein